MCAALSEWPSLLFAHDCQSLLGIHGDHLRSHATSAHVAIFHTQTANPMRPKHHPLETNRLLNAHFILIINHTGKIIKVFWRFVSELPTCCCCYCCCFFYFVIYFFSFVRCCWLVVFEEINNQTVCNRANGLIILEYRFCVGRVLCKSWL